MHSPRLYSLDCPSAVAACEVLWIRFIYYLFICLFICLFLCLFITWLMYAFIYLSLRSDSRPAVVSFFETGGLFYRRYRQNSWGKDDTEIGSYPYISISISSLHISVMGLPSLLPCFLPSLPPSLRPSLPPRLLHCLHFPVCFFLFSFVWFLFLCRRALLRIWLHSSEWRAH